MKRVSWSYLVVCIFMKLSVDAQILFWNYRTNVIGGNEDIYDCCIVSNIAIVVGGGEDRGICVSTDFCSWIQVDIPSTNEVLNICHGNGTFVASGDRDVMASTNGLDWVMQANTGGVVYSRGIMWSGKRFFGFGDVVGTISWSSNGIDWTKEQVTTNWLFLMYATNDYVFCVGVDGTVYESPRKGEWVRLCNCNLPQDTIWYSIPVICSHKGGWLIAGMTEEEQSVILYSTNKCEWTEVTLNSFHKLFDIKSNGKYAMACGYDVLISEDGRVWRKLPSDYTHRYQNIACDADCFLLAGEYAFPGAGALAFFKPPPELMINRLTDHLRLSASSHRLGFTYDFESSEDWLTWSNVSSSIGSNDCVVSSMPFINKMGIIRVRERNTNLVPPSAHITGTVTGPDGVIPLNGVYVYAMSRAWNGRGYTYASGAYDIGGLPTGTYQVRFYDVRGIYLTEWYNNMTNWKSATDIVVTNLAIVSNINASLRQVSP